MNARGDDVEDTLCTSRRYTSSLTTSLTSTARVNRYLTHLLGQVRHRERLIQQPQLALFALLVFWVSENTTIQQCAMYICYHRSDVPCTIRRLAWAGVFDGLEVVDDGRIEIHRVALIERVDFASGRNRDLVMNVLVRVAITFDPVIMLTSGWVKMNSPRETSRV